MNILEDLWFGNISPWERPFKCENRRESAVCTAK